MKEGGKEGRFEQKKEGRNKRRVMVGGEGGLGCKLIFQKNCNLISSMYSNWRNYLVII